MNKLLVALIAGAFASVAAAQTAAPKLTTKEKQEAVKSTTTLQSESGSKMLEAEQKANVKASREVAKMTKAEKEIWAKEINKQLLNPDNPSGTFGTATMQKQTTEASKAVPKMAAPKLGSPEGQKALEKAATK